MAQATKVGIIGAGWPGRKHAEGYQGSGGFSVLAVADLIPSRRRAVMEQFKAQREYAEAEALIADKDVEVVSVCLPNHLHLPVTLAALKAGKHVVCETPPTVNAAEAKKIAAQADAVGVGVAPHNPLGPIAGVAALHFAVSTPNHVIQEEMVGAVPWYFDVVQGPIKRIDGYWEIPEAVGLGIEVNEAECARHPFAPEVIHTRNAVMPDGTIVDW